MFSPPHWLPVRLDFCHKWGFCVLYIPFTQISVKFFGVFFEHLILEILGFFFSISSKSLVFWLHFLLQFLCQPCYFPRICQCIFLKIFLSLLLRFPLSDPIPVSANIDISFLQLLICLCILSFQKFSFLIFLHLLLVWFIVSVIIVATAYIKLFIYLIADLLLLLYFSELITFLCLSYTTSKFYIVTISVNCWFASCKDTTLICHHFRILEA